jgi:hypothetical protein
MKVCIISNEECKISIEKVKGYFGEIKNKGRRSRRGEEFILDPYEKGYRE